MWCSACWSQLGEYEVVRLSEYCPACWSPLSIDEPVPYDPISYSPQIQSETIDPIYFKPESRDFDYIPCPACDELLLWGQGVCRGCAVVYEPEFWYAVSQNLSDDEISAAIEAFGDTYGTSTLCCLSDIEDCICEEPILESDVEDIPPESIQRAYALGLGSKKCSDCVHYFKTTCGPFVEWVKTYLLEGRDDEPVDVCMSYEPLRSRSHAVAD